MTGLNQADLVADFALRRRAKLTILVVVGGWVCLAASLTVAFVVTAPRMAVFGVLLVVYGLALCISMYRVRVVVFIDRIFIRNWIRSSWVEKSEIIAFTPGRYGRLERSAAINLVTKDRRIGLDACGHNPPLTRRATATRDTELRVLQDWLQRGPN